MASSSSNRNRNRIDVIESITEAPYPAVQRLGAAPLHGPSRDKHIVFILGVGPGLGLAIAHVFAQQGYTIAIASRNKQRLDAWAKELDHIVRSARPSADNGDKPQCLAFSCDVLSSAAIEKTFDDVLAAWPGKKLGTAVFNASVRKRAPFEEYTSQQLNESVQANIIGGFAFMQKAVQLMNRLNDGQGGNVLVTGATSSIRGREGFAAFAATKGGLRQICQSVAREHMPNKIHVAHVIVDGLIDSQQARSYLGLQKSQRFGNDTVLRPDEMAKSWLFLASQDQSGWTFEMDLRPAKEHF